VVPPELPDPTEDPDPLKDLTVPVPPDEEDLPLETERDSTLLLL